MSDRPHPLRWYMILFLMAFFVIIFLFFSTATKPEPQIVIETPEESLSEPIIRFIDPKKGDEDASVVIVEYGDFECTACKTLSENLSRLVQEYPNSVQVVWKDMPNESQHPQATPAALAARCADEQDAFWTYHDELFLRQDQLSSETYAQIAEDLGLNTRTFENCFTSQEYLPRIEQTFEEGLALEITAVPTIFIGEDRFVGSLSFIELSAIVETYLASN